MYWVGTSARCRDHHRLRGSIARPLLTIEVIMIEWDVTFGGLLQALNRVTLSSVPGFKECDFCLSPSLCATLFFQDFPIPPPGPSSLQLLSPHPQPPPSHLPPSPFASY